MKKKNTEKETVKTKTAPEAKKATDKKTKSKAAPEKKQEEKAKRKHTPKPPNANGKIAYTKPFKEVDVNKVREYAALGLSMDKIATLCGISPRTFNERNKDTAEIADAIKSGRAIGEAKMADMLKNLALDPENPNMTALIFYLKTRCGWIENARAINEKERDDILKQVLDKKLSAIDAAMMFDMKGIPIPDSIRIQASKEQPEPEDPTAGAYSSISEEEMARQHAERMAERDRQRSIWLTERREEVLKLKEATKDADAFSPEKTGEAK